MHIALIGFLSCLWIVRSKYFLIIVSCVLYLLIARPLVRVYHAGAHCLLMEIVRMEIIVVNLAYTEGRTFFTSIIFGSVTSRTSLNVAIVNQLHCKRELKGNRESNNIMI